MNRLNTTPNLDDQVERPRSAEAGDLQVKLTDPKDTECEKGVSDQSKLDEPTRDTAKSKSSTKDTEWKSMLDSSSF